MALIFSLRRAGDTASFEALVRPHLQRLYRLAYRYTGSAEDAEDLIQSLLTKLLPQVKTLTAVEQLGPWLARALHNLYVDQVRRRQTSPVDLAVSDDDATLLQVVDEVSETPEQTAERHCTRERLLAALQRLPREQRALVVWHDVEGYTLEELAGTHGIALGTLKSRLHRARARLRELLMEPSTPPPRVRE